MTRIAPDFFALCIKDLIKIENEFSAKSTPDTEALISDNDCESVRNLMFIVENLCTQLGMQLWIDEPVGRIAKVSSLIKGGFTYEGDGRSYLSVRSEIKQLRQSIEHSLRKRLFLFVPFEDAAFYDREDLFGIADRFPTSNKEIILAGNCYATGNPTACVFHLMRAVELGAKSMVRSMKAQKYITKPVLIRGNGR